VTPISLENKKDKAKNISFDAKKARGAMARFILQNWLRERADLLHFNVKGYCYQPYLSDGDNLVFMSDAAF